MLLGRIERLTRLGPPLVLAAPLACVRPPLPETCPEVQAGDLVITEFRGSQPGSYRQWIEVYNAGEEDIPLAGIAVVFTQQDGDLGGRFIVRDHELVLAPGTYAVLGGGDPERYAYVDYDYTVDWHSALDPEQPDVAPDPKDLPGAGFVDLVSCGALIDRVLLRGLPDEGSLFWPGAPDAGANDDGADWCVDAVTMTPTGVGLFGSPGEANPTCP